jgi:hypothetical protein
MKTVQYFTKEYLDACKKMSVGEILEYLEQFRLLQATPAKSKLISIKIPADLLSAFKRKAALYNTPYQTMIKKLLQKWVQNEHEQPTEAQDRQTG